VLEAERRHDTPPGTIMLGGRLVRIDVIEPGQEETESEGQAEPAETEAEAQVTGQTKVQHEEHPLWRLTCACT